MLKRLDKIWCWHGWTIVKWPFGVAVLYLVLFLIYSVTVVKDYAHKINNLPVEIWRDIKSIEIPAIELPKSENIKNL